MLLTCARLILAFGLALGLSFAALFALLLLFGFSLLIIFIFMFGFLLKPLLPTFVCPLTVIVDAFLTHRDEKRAVVVGILTAQKEVRSVEVENSLRHPDMVVCGRTEWMTRFLVLNKCVVVLFSTWK